MEQITKLVARAIRAKAAVAADSCALFDIKGALFIVLILLVLALVGGGK